MEREANLGRSGLMQQTALRRLLKDDRCEMCDHSEGTPDWQYMQGTAERRHRDPLQVSCTGRRAHSSMERELQVADWRRVAGNEEAGARPKGLVS